MADGVVLRAHEYYLWMFYKIQHGHWPLQFLRSSDTTPSIIGNGFHFLARTAVHPSISTKLYTTSATTGGHGDNLTAAAFECLPDQAASLLRQKRSFSFDYATTTLLSWEGDGTDCCCWEGVGCDTVTGLVNALNLSSRGLYSYGIDPALFNLTSMKLLDLSMNDFGGSELPAARFERLSSTKDHDIVLDS
ncbi:unnamed protein product [Miscanthus lutarioriparius]|uniref:Leucine-rich repeat-containing N-terminal plant-type domain-containing protein n=1 Tax=Miscanthus lutarioriparius TaxID=422564 RepID=A0A811NB01_9POAL|nr:unnamed protein product [Miscanthus lutarioriparius]